MAQVDDSPKLKEPFVSNYDPRVFYTPMYVESSQPTKPVRKFAEPIKLTVTLKDIGLEGLDSSNPNLASKIFQRNLQKKQRKSPRKARTQQQRSVSPTKTQTMPIHPPSVQNHQMSPRTLKIMVFEGDSLKNKKPNADHKPIGLLSASQRPQKPQPIIPKVSPRGSPRLNTSASGSGIFNSVEKNSNDRIDSEKSMQKCEEDEKLSIKPLGKLFESKQEEEDLSIKPLEKLSEKEQKNEEEDLSIKPLGKLSEKEQKNEEEDLSIKPLEKLSEKEQKNEEEEKLSLKPTEQFSEKGQTNEEEEKLTLKPLQNLLGVDQGEKEKPPLEPKYLITVIDNRSQCYDGIWINADRGMPGNPLEKELKEQEEREAAE